MNESKTKLFKQRLYQIHSSVGITLSLFLYISLFFGIFTIFLPYIKVWEKPSLHFEQHSNENIDYERILESVLLDPDYPKNNLYLELPDFSKNPTLRISHNFMETLYFNPNDGEKITPNNNSNLSGFINDMHYGKPLKNIGEILFGLIAVGSILLLVGGLLLIIKLKFQQNGKSNQANFSKWHRKIFIYTTPIFLLILLSGALLTIGYSNSEPLTSAITQGKSDDFMETTRSVFNAKEEIIRPIKEPATMMPIQKLIEVAKGINPTANFHRIRLIHYKDKNAKVEFIGYNPYKPFVTGVYNQEKLLLSAVDGSIIKDYRGEEANWAVIFDNSYHYLHFLYEVDIFTRLFVALVMFATLLAIGFGVMLWLEKKAKTFDNNIPFYHWMGKLSLTIMIGVIPATATLFISQWFLTFEMENRVLMQQSIFFNLWLATLFWSFYRLNSYQTAKELLTLGGILFIIAPIYHWYTVGLSPISFMQYGMTNILSVDISLLLLGVSLYAIAKKLPTKRSEAKLFWNHNYKGTK